MNNSSMVHFKMQLGWGTKLTLLLIAVYGVYNPRRSINTLEQGLCMNNFINGCTTAVELTTASMKEVYGLLLKEIEDSTKYKWKMTLSEVTTSNKRRFLVLTFEGKRKHFPPREVGFAVEPNFGGGISIHSTACEAVFSNPIAYCRKYRVRMVWKDLQCGSKQILGELFPEANFGKDDSFALCSFIGQEW